MTPKRIVFGLQDESRRSKLSRYDHQLHDAFLVAQVLTIVWLKKKRGAQICRTCPEILLYSNSMATIESFHLTDDRLAQRVMAGDHKKSKERRKCQSWRSQVPFQPKPSGSLCLTNTCCVICGSSFEATTRY